ncbi:hypothetical protein CALVIDRAFT_599543 [Calocera viscosa TUFC12733]|uniref:Uncharacterized protein n=1 Tax=Calocera viscosa (strain TUFC12733) TaxID=1330018 RepID=A0A167KM51_CALVF|nr:hypothetical protein CALVIDRAFT_599543 [Calocera viscosa TUFC12733]
MAGSLTAEANGPQANQVPSPIVVIQPPTPGDVPSEGGKLMSVNNPALHGLDAPNVFTKAEEPKQRDDGSGGECPGELAGLKSGREKHTAPVTTAKAITDELTRSTPSTIGTEARSSGDLPKEKFYPGHDNLFLELDEAEICDIEEVEEMIGVEAEAVDPECLIAFDA